MKVQVEHCAAGCNRVVNALHWSDNGLIAYGAHHAVILYDPERTKIIASIVGHKDTVNCVCWFSPSDFTGLSTDNNNSQQPTLLASGAADGTVNIWSITNYSTWALVASLKGHTGPVTSIALHNSLPGQQVILVSTAGDGKVNIWHCTAITPSDVTQESWSLQQTLTVPYQHIATMTRCPPTNAAAPLLLAVGGVDAAVRLFIRHNNSEFIQVCKLTGHSDWVRGLAFTPPPDGGGKLLLASASQDKYIRLWSIAPESYSSSLKLHSTLEASTTKLEGAAAELLTRYAPKPRFSVSPPGEAPTADTMYIAALEALLIGHEDWVHSVDWLRTSTDGMCLLSSSMDRTMMLWVCDTATGLWLSQEAVGDAGANHLGYYTSAFSPNGQNIVAHGFTGALHMWKRTADATGWEPQLAGGGHVGAVVDCDWCVDDGAGTVCLLSASIDQTVRLSMRLPSGDWCEAARPQVHGHDFNAVCAVPGKRVRFASASEEKMIRVFQAPKVFLDTLTMLSGGAYTPKQQFLGKGEEEPLPSSLLDNDEQAFGAVLPALGLSNKAMYADNDAHTVMTSNVATVPEAEGLGCGDYNAAGSDLAPSCAPSAVEKPPLEEHLSQNTLWPELHKLYGHGNEVYCLAADPRGRFLASACRAQSATTASIWLWNTTTWSPAGPPLEGHTLTVTQLAFSPDGEKLASCSRDRTIQIYQRSDNKNNQSSPFTLVAKLKAHSRIIWSLCWSPDSRYLATAARDNTVKIWDFDTTNKEAPTAALCSVSFPDSVRSIAFAPTDSSNNNKYVLAAGLEDGSIHIMQLDTSIQMMHIVWSSGIYEVHSAAVRRLVWRRDSGGSVYHLASCSDDHSIKVFTVQL